MSIVSALQRYDRWVQYLTGKNRCSFVRLYHALFTALWRLRDSSGPYVLRICPSMICWITFSCFQTTKNNNFQTTYNCGKPIQKSWCFLLLFFERVRFYFNRGLRTCLFSKRCTEIIKMSANFAISHFAYKNWTLLKISLPIPICHLKTCSNFRISDLLIKR